ncbi:MAG TPA: response regulator transcription factor [Polyangiaceae bacterium]|jgi:DNA-binding NarL/FixJ family response regulator|nr:response regulator transcription factor [Polyangiaceae bacterium]
MLALLLGAAVFADSAIVRRGLAEILGSTDGVTVVQSAPLAEARSGASEGVNVVVADVPDASSVEVALAQLPTAPVLALVAEAEHGRVLVRGGARGALARDASSERVAAASLAVASGLYVFDGETVAPLLARGAPAGDPALLSARERAVLDLVAEGLSNRAIGERLGVSEHTAKFHVRSLLDKLGADTRADAVARAARRGLLTL